MAILFEIQKWRFLFSLIYFKDWQVTCVRMAQPINAWLLELNQSWSLIRETRPFSWTIGSIRMGLLLLYLPSYLAGNVTQVYAFCGKAHAFGPSFSFSSLAEKLVLTWSTPFVTGSTFFAWPLEGGSTAPIETGFAKPSHTAGQACPGTTRVQEWAELPRLWSSPPWVKTW